ncbi:MAG: hypothetical protein H6739_07510 [Alphaproteobacteria bacterium]|nr:hypothetical protein [Alphaproteobacteria bacterium]
MTRQDILDQLAAHRERVTQAQAAGDRLAEADARAHVASSHTLLGQLAEGAAELGQAARLAFNENQLAKQGQYLYTQALLLSRLPEHRAEAEKGFTQARATARFSDDPDTEVKAFQRLVGLYADAQDYDAAVGTLDTFIERLTELGRDEDRVTALRMRASFNLARGATRMPAVVDDLEAAIALCEVMGDEKTALQLRMELRVTRDFMRPDHVPEDFSAFIDEAESLGDKALLGDARYQAAASAIRAGQYKEALIHAEGARRAALDAPDPVRYLLACMLIAEARDKLGDRPGVLAILLTAKVTLEDYLGKWAGQQVVLVLNSLEHRWGKEGVQIALKAYRARVKQQNPEA